MEIENELKLVRRIEKHLEHESMILAENNIDVRLKLKKVTGEKVQILFVCYRPEVWNSLKTVYEAFQEDPVFEVTVLAIPNKMQLPKKGFNHEEYESEGAEEFWKEQECIHGYDYQKKEWVDPRDLHPDYVFFQRPYNVTCSAKYKSWIVSKYAKICYVTYGYEIFEEETFTSMHPEDFLASTSFYFAPNELHYELICQRLKSIDNYFTRPYITGFPRFDLGYFAGEKEKKDMFAALWTPRWSTREGNCFFFDYKDLLLSYCDLNETFSLIFRPHPQSFLEWNATGEMTVEEEKAYRKEYEKRRNAKIDVNKDYLVSFEEVDCFITDITSLMPEYLLTGKPIIYCHRVDTFSEHGKNLAEGFYWVRTWEELKETLDMLSTGKDPLKEKRKEVIQKCFYLPSGGAGVKIKEIIKKDALK